LTRLLLFLIAVYKRLLSPLLGSQCRFHPTCSSYASVAIARFGPLRGTLLAIWRILRCQPLCTGGFDPVPERFVLRGCRADHSRNTE
jgi:uncharacterized protein